MLVLAGIQPGHSQHRTISAVVDTISTVAGETRTVKSSRKINALSIDMAVVQPRGAIGVTFVDCK